MKTSQAKRITNIHEVEINAAAETIFPLACPVEELKWIEGWGEQYEMIFSESGVNEKNCIFKEKMSGPVLVEKPIMTTWVTTIHDPENRCIEFLIIIGDKAIMNIQFDIRVTEKETSMCRWKLILTALDSETNQIPEETMKERMQAVTSALSMMLKHYCETGEMMTSG